MRNGLHFVNNNIEWEEEGSLKLRYEVYIAVPPHLARIVDLPFLAGYMIIHISSYTA